MNSTHWEVIKEFYQREFGIDGWIVEMYANLDILSLCVSGACNDSIVKFLELPMAEVIKAISDVFEFDGWKSDLPFNPYKMWNLYDGDKSSVDHFISFTEEVSAEISKNGLSYLKPEKLYYMCEAFKDIEERIQNEWI